MARSPAHLPEHVRPVSGERSRAARALNTGRRQFVLAVDLVLSSFSSVQLSSSTRSGLRVSDHTPQEYTQSAGGDWSRPKPLSMTRAARGERPAAVHRARTSHGTHDDDYLNSYGP